MKSPTFLQRPSKPSAWLLLRRVHGASMEPGLPPGKLIVASALYLRLRPGDIVVVRHDGLEKIKRVKKLRKDELFVVGDNAAHSTDSRQFGWVTREQVVAKVVSVFSGRRRGRR